MDDEKRCNATNKQGLRCKLPKIQDKEYCQFHYSDSSYNKYLANRRKWREAQKLAERRSSR